MATANTRGLVYLHPLGCGCRGVKAPSPGEAQEQPQYADLARAINGQWERVTKAADQLRTAWFRAANLGDPAKAEGDPPDTRAIDQAIEAFMREMAGARRSRAGFSSPDNDGAIQESIWLAHRVGVDRAVRLTGAEGPESSPLTRQAKQHLASEAFSRLTEDGRLRFEDRLGEIKQAMLDGFNEGTNPIKIARDLGQDLDGYHQGRLLTIVRTESALASEAAIRDELRAQGVSKVEVIGDPGTDQACVSRIGNQYDLDDQDNLPPFHPNCLCSIISVGE